MSRSAPQLFNKRVGFFQQLNSTVARGTRPRALATSTATPGGTACVCEDGWRVNASEGRDESCA